MLISMPSPNSGTTKVHSVLADPVRRQIVQLLKTKHKAGFIELHDALRIKMGALYHHLEELEGLVKQGPDKKYVLTEEGKSALENLTVSEEEFATYAPASAGRKDRLVPLSKELLFGRPLFDYLNHDPIRTVPLAILIVLFGGWLSAQTNLEPLLLFYLSPSAGVSQAWFVVLFPLGWLATFALCDFLSITVFKRKGGDLNLLNGTAVAMLPLLVVPGIAFVAQLFSTSITVQAYLLVLPIILQVWVVCLLSSAISISKGMTVEKSAVVSFAVIYLNVIVLLASLGLGIF